MDIEQIKSFCAITKFKSFRKAAEFLNISQPGVSRRIKSLEDELGVTLLLRTPQSVIVTKQGKEFLSYAERTLKILEEGMKQVLDGERQERLLIAGTPSVNLSFLPKVIKMFKEQVNLNINLYTAHSQQIFDMLLDQTIDFGFITTTFPNPLIKYEKVYTGNFCCVGHPDLVKKYINKNNIVKYPIPIIFNSGLYTEPWKSINNYLTNNRYYEFAVEVQQSTLVSVELAKAGIGLAIIPYSDAKIDLKDNRLIKVILPDFELPKRSIFIIFYKDKLLTEKEKLFIQTAKLTVNENTALDHL